MKTIYVGNLPFTTSEDELRSLFSAHGTVESAKLVIDRDTGRPRGFGFIEMNDDEASAAITALNGFESSGRRLRVNESERREPSQAKGW
jgi:RNA recognition motif-containing protein